MSKASILNKLSKFADIFTIDSYVTFYEHEWNNHLENIVDMIQKQFSEWVIVRSSAYNEDSTVNSLAGHYYSQHFVNPTSKKALIDAINKVVASYKKDEFQKENQIIVQSQIIDVLYAGVIFSCDIRNGSPYYSVHYYPSDTQSVTQGIADQSLYIPKDKWRTTPKPFLRLIQSVRKIEELLPWKYLDIEYAIDKQGQIHIFQARPLNKVPDLKISLTEFSTALSRVHRKLTGFSKCYSKLKPEKKTVLSDMTDWNPAEMIGHRPRPLAYSLYRFLITKESWATGRASIGYHDLSGHELMYSFASKPYIDTQLSFLSLLPSGIPVPLRDKLVQKQIVSLQRHPELNDKTEFEILLTCLDLEGRRIRRLKVDYGLSTGEQRIIKDELIKHTDYILKHYSRLISEDKLLCKDLESQCRIYKKN